MFRWVFYAPSKTVADAANTALKAKIDTLNAVMSDYFPESELNRLCQTSGTGKKVKVSNDLWRVLKASQQYSKKTQGAFDITIGTLTRLWRRARSLKEMPDSTHIKTAHGLVNYRNIKMHRFSHRVRLQKQGMKLDLGGIGQGFAADECLYLLKKQYGITAAMIDAGGDIALGDAPLGQTGWRIELPYADSTEVKLLSHCGVTVSGAKYRYVELDGHRYSHIIDPHSGWPLTKHVKTMTIAPTCTQADAWATALCVMNVDAALRRSIEAENPGLKFWIFRDKDASSVKY